MKRLTVFLLIGFSLLLSACNMSLAEDVTPPPWYVSPTPAPTLGPLYPASAPDLANGAAIYSTECAPCHGDTGLGDGPLNKQLSVPVAAIGLPVISQKASPADWFMIVSQGKMERMMPPFSNKLSEQERWDVVAYALSLHASPEMIAQGKQVVAENCASCDMDFFTSQEKMASLSDDDLLGLMVQGSDAFPAFGANLGEDELYSAAVYLRSLAFAAPTPAAVIATPVAAGTITPAPEGYPNPVEGTPSAVAGLGTVRGSVLLSGGNPPAGLTATLHGFDHAMDASGPQEVLTLTASPDKDGSLVFENIELPANRILLVDVEYKGITYQSEMYIVEEGASDVTLTPLNLYETSDDLYALTVDQGHVFLDVSEGQVQIIEFISVVNSGESAIIVPVTDDMMALAKSPAGTTSLGYDAQQGEASPVDAADGFAIPPSEKVYGLVAGFQMAYDKSAELEIPFVLGMPAESSIFVPVGVKLEGKALTDLGQQDIGNGTIYQVYGFGPVPADGSLAVSLSGQPNPAATGTETAPDSRQLVIIGAGSLGILLLGMGVWLYLRDRKQNEAGDEEDEDGDEFEDASSVLDAIIAIDDLHRAGKIPAEAHQKRRAELKELYKKLESRD